jgi:hypothetical protein
VAGSRLLHDELLSRFTEAVHEAQRRPLIVLPSGRPEVPPRTRRRFELQSRRGRMLRHVRRLRVDGLRPKDDSYDAFVYTQILRRGLWLPEDLGLRREGS